MDDEIIYSWCFHDVECFDSTPSAAIIILDKDLESFSSLRSQQQYHPRPMSSLGFILFSLAEDVKLSALGRHPKIILPFSFMFFISVSF